MYFPQKWLSIGRLDVLLAKTLDASLLATVSSSQCLDMAGGKIENGLEHGFVKCRLNYLLITYPLRLTTEMKATEQSTLFIILRCNCPTRLCLTQEYMTVHKNFKKSNLIIIPNETKLFPRKAGAALIRAKNIFISIYIYRWRCPCCCLATVQTKFEWCQTKGRLLGSNRLEDRLASDAICSCYATEPISTGQKRPGLVTIKENRCLTMAHSHVYSLRAEHVYSSSSEKCLLLVKHDHIVMQMNHRRTHKGQDRFAEGD